MCCEVKNCQTLSYRGSGSGFSCRLNQNSDPEPDTDNINPDPKQWLVKPPLFTHLEREKELRVSERVLCYTDEEVIRGNGVVILEEGREA